MSFEKVEGSFINCLTELGIKKGDILYVSSDIKTLLFNFQAQG